MQYTNFHPILSSYVKVGAYRAKAKVLLNQYINRYYIMMNT